MGVGETLLNNLSTVAGNITKANIVFTTSEHKVVTKETGGANGTTSAATTQTIPASTNTLEVQFNPASLAIDAYGGGHTAIANFGVQGANNQNTHTFGEHPTYITISFTLIFDATFVQDAFGFDKFQLQMGTLVKDAASLISSATGKSYTVRPYVEGFLAAVRDADHKTITLDWGALSYTGIMNSVDCNYTMFNPVGEPIRAEINVTLVSASKGQETYQEHVDDNANQVQTSGNDYFGEWTKRYENIVGGNDTLSGSTIKNSLTSLINL